MIILGNVTEVKDERRFRIAWYHRVPIGLERNTWVHVVLLPTSVSLPVRHNMAEVILTPINPWRWGDLWKIECRFDERPGVVAGILDHLQRNNINILISESITTQRDKVHSVSIIADMANYEDEDGGNLERIGKRDLPRLTNLETRLGIECIEDIRMRDAQPDVKITRMWDFYHAYSHFRAYPSPSFNPGAITVKPHGEIEIAEPVLIKEIKRQILGKKYEEGRQESKITQVLLFTNTEERYISALFPDPSHHIAMYELVHREKIGALSLLAKTIKDLDVNILSSFNRLVQMGTEAHWNVILDIGDGDSGDIMNEIRSRATKADPNLLKEIKSRDVIPFDKTFRV